MHWRAIIRLFGILLIVYSLGFLPSLGIALVTQDGLWLAFVWSMLISMSVGGLMWLTNLRQRSELSIRDGFLVVALFWILLSLTGALPFLFGLQLSLTDAVFESTSGFTTTGATTLVGLDDLPRSILYHRQQIQWLGGMGIIVLAVAILPLLGVGGMQLYRAETAGVAKQQKLTPRLTETARVLWLIYVVLTLLCALAYWLAGMEMFDAIGHAYTTIATGGFSTRDASLGYFDSALIESITIFFMLAGGANFAVHFLVWRRKSLRPYLDDAEVRGYGQIVFFATLFIAFSLYLTGAYTGTWEALRHAAFQVTSVITGTGYGTATFADWPLHIPLVLVILAFTGGCVGSTTGGLKVMRVILLAKLGVRQLFQLAHPQAVVVVKLGKRPVAEDVLFSVWGFYVLYIVTALLLTVAMMGAGLDLESAFGAVVATITLLGPGLGEVAGHFAEVNAMVKWLGVIGMLVGRLEVFALLILFLPAYWRH
jgi:trk system potassium uptake protein TrkH